MGAGAACFALCASRAWRRYSLLGSTGLELPGAGEDGGDEAVDWLCRRVVELGILTLLCMTWVWNVFGSKYLIKRSTVVA